MSRFYENGLTDEQLRATPVPVSMTGSPSGGLTDAELRATPVPVSGVLTDAQLRATPVPVSGALTDAQLRATPVPVSGALTDAQLRATPVPVSGALTDTQLRATAVPVSLAANQSVNLAQVAGVAIPTGNGVAAGAQRVAIASDNLLVPVKDNVQNNRVIRNFILNVFTAAPVADAMQSVEQWYNNAAVAATVSPAVVPAGKTLRLTGGRIETKSLATVGSVVMRVRINTAGTAVIGSPIAGSVSCGSRAGATTVAMTGGHDHAEFSFGDEGLEIPSAAGVGFSLAGYGPTGTLTLQGVTRFEVWGYEYTT